MGQSLAISRVFESGQWGMREEGVALSSSGREEGFLERIGTRRSS